MKRFLLMITCCFIFFNLYAQDDNPTLAILDVSGENISSIQSTLVYEYIIDRMNRSKTYTLVERSALNRALEELEISMSDIVDESTAVQIGKVAGARYVLITSLIKIDDEYHLSMRVVNVETSKIENTAIDKTDKFSKIDVLTQAAVDRLFDLDPGRIAEEPEPVIEEEPEEEPDKVDPDDRVVKEDLPSPKEADTGPPAESKFLVLTAGGGATVPISDVTAVFGVGMNGLVNVSYNMKNGPGYLGLGITSGAVMESTHSLQDPNYKGNQEFTLVAIPAFGSVKYHFPMGDIYFGAEGAGGVLLNMALFPQDPNAPPDQQNQNPPLTPVPAASGGLYGGMRLKSGTGITVYAQYLHGFYTNAPYTGITAGVRVELQM